METTLGDTGGRREQNLLKVCALIYTEKNLFLYSIRQLLLIWEHCETLTIVSLVRTEVVCCIIRKLNDDTM
uniref:Uncharacterized protein n=1 Tax=Arundo donax TaxID=35708 RepID=A0A0A8XYK4_ARUDO